MEKTYPSLGLLGLLLLPALACAAAADPLVHCPRDDKLSACFGESMLGIIRSMLTGDPGHFVPKLDPILVPVMPINRHDGQVLNMNLTLFDLTIADIARDVTVKSSKFDYDNLELTLLLQRPSIYFHGNYKIAGKILWLPIWGDGVMSMRMTDVRETFHLVGERRAGEDGRPYLLVKEYSSALEPGLLTVQYDNLFGGNRILGKGANTLLNAQWKTIYSQIQPITDAHFSTIMKPYWTDIFKHINLDEAFPA